MAFDPPDFRKLTLDQIRDEISAVNKLVVLVRDFQKDQRKKFWLLYGTGTVATVGASAVFPPAGLAMAAFTVFSSMDSSVQSSMAKKLKRDAEEYRKTLKTVYRARPGRKQFNLAARRSRENERNIRALKKFIPPFPGW